MPVDTQITIKVDGETTTVATGTTAAELFFERREVVVARVDGVDCIASQTSRRDGSDVHSPAM